MQRDANVSKDMVIQERTGLDRSMLLGFFGHDGGGIKMIPKTAVLDLNLVGLERSFTEQSPLSFSGA